MPILKEETDLDKNNYIVVRNLLSSDICKITEQYCLFEMLNNFKSVDPQVPGTHSIHGDSLTETLLLYLKPKIEELTNKSLIPTYSYYRVYKPGDILEDHDDRESCEISATLTIGFKYNNVSDDYRWSLHGYVGDEKRYFKCDVGDAVIYRGIELTHGRDRFDVGEHSYQVQVFLHYVDANGPYANEFKYDKRPAIGFKKNR
jgi:hypothetical protein